MSSTVPDLGDTEQLKTLLEDVASPDQLRELLDAPGVDDAMIDGFVAAVGAEGVLDKVFGLMGEHFVAERAGNDAGVIRWDVTAPGGTLSYGLSIRDGAAIGERGAPDGPKVTLTLSVPTLLRLCAGRLNGVQGFMTGQIKLSGDMMFGAKLPGWFDY
ncbi:SCP2 sterol-binding domain-containing protein [Actinomadura verrucosospora]|uniref:Sterol-binding domain-containing protein n=1 Tax=Actinomadura verrucosospora TaxID=46165 RepID=A0A7D3ZSR4_ACTVE|nr:SCP2 sterol-binding domain-containing protein [Actinomadura verrucosospora]QKG26823.1 sterol-binding domain-containing protein [Actinomadura verrucosospora]